MQHQRFFFCGVGGSGMLPLASYLKAAGHEVEGSDRAFDQGRLAPLQARIEAMGIVIHPQDGSGLQSAAQVLVTSSAVEATIPDVAAAQRLGAVHQIRAEVLAALTNEAPVSVGVAGTSGKSTTTAMLSHILATSGQNPGVINGAGMLNVRDDEGQPLGWRRGEGPFVCEVDESDGSIARYTPSIGVVLNISEDHKTMDELKDLFSGFAQRSGHAVLGIDSDPVAALAGGGAVGEATTFAIGRDADLRAEAIQEEPGFVAAQVSGFGQRSIRLRLPMIGRFNISNALGALAAAHRLGVSLEDGCTALEGFAGTARRLRKVGEARGISVIDDFAHNPEKIAASLSALTAQYSRLHLLYQPHGYGPLTTFRPLYEEAFRAGLRPKDRLVIVEPLNFGGSVTITDDAKLLASHVGSQAIYQEKRGTFVDEARKAEAGEAVVIMGARDDTLTDFAQDILHRLEEG